MPAVRFIIQVDCEDDEPSRVVPFIHGDILELSEDSDAESKIGEISAYLLQRGRAMDEEENTFEAMDSISTSTSECFEALLDPETHDWKKSVQKLYSDEIPGHDVLYIEKIELEPSWRGKGIGAQVVRTLIATFGSSCGLVACKPFALQYVNWKATENQHLRKTPGFEAKRLADFGKVETFWFGLGFRALPDCDFYSFAPQLLEQPLPATPHDRTRVN